METSNGVVQPMWRRDEKFSDLTQATILKPEPEQKVINSLMSILRHTTLKNHCGPSRYPSNPIGNTCPSPYARHDTTTFVDLIYDRR